MILFNYLLIALSVSALSFTLSTTGIAKQFRERISTWGQFWEELIHCPYCISFYITIVLINFSPYQIYDFFILDWVVTVFSIMCVSGLCHYVLLRAYAPVAEQLVRRQIQKLKDESRLNK